VCATTHNKLSAFVHLPSSSEDEEKQKFSIKYYAYEFYLLYDWIKATIQEQLSVQMNFTQMAKMHTFL